MQDTDNLGPAGSGQTSEGVLPYLAVGCLTAASGLMGSAMIAVLLAKIVGFATGCAADAETGAPCNWLTYALRGGLLGMVLIPTIVIRRMRKTRAASRNSE
ncbi:MAG: hypothetical protein ABJE47_15345 [bacterium]